jgi:small subunit ribosomal protein S20
MRTSEEEQLRNRSVRTTLKGAIKELKATQQPEEASGKLKTAVSKIDQAVGKKIIHKNKAARLKSRLAGFVNSLNKTE